MTSPVLTQPAHHDDAGDFKLEKSKEAGAQKRFVTDSLSTSCIVTAIDTTVPRKAEGQNQLAVLKKQ